MIVFICTPYGAAEEELERVRACCACELDLGNVPFAPQLLFSQFSDGAAGSIAGDAGGGAANIDDILLGLEMLPRLDALHVYDEGAMNARMRREIAYARSIDIPVLYMN